MNRNRTSFAAAILLAGAAWSASGQQDPEMTSYSPPPPGRTSTGGKPPAPAPDFAKLRGPLKVRGTEIKTRDAAYPGEPALIGLGQSPAEVRATLGLELRAKKAVTPDAEELRRRTLALYGDAGPAPANAPRRSGRSPSGEAEESGHAVAWWLGSGAVVAAAAAFLFRRLRQRPVTH